MQHVTGGLAAQLHVTAVCMLQQNTQGEAQYSQFDCDARELSLLDLVVHKRSQARLQVQAATRAGLRQMHVS